MQGCWWSHWSHPQSVVRGEEEGFCEKRLGHLWYRSVQIMVILSHQLLFIYSHYQETLAFSTTVW